MTVSSTTLHSRAFPALPGELSLGFRLEMMLVRARERWILLKERERWVLMKIPRCDIDGVGEVEKYKSLRILSILHCVPNKCANRQPSETETQGKRLVFARRERWVLLKIPRGDIDGVGEVK